MYCMEMSDTKFARRRAEGVRKVRKIVRKTLDMRRHIIYNISRFDFVEISGSRAPYMQGAHSGKREPNARKQARSDSIKYVKEGVLI